VVQRVAEQARQHARQHGPAQRPGPPLPLALPPEALAEWHLGQQRALALEGEAAALGALLGEGEG
ncbi:hypothetical protein, partial [Hymenobacter ruricola]